MREERGVGWGLRERPSLVLWRVWFITASDLELLLVFEKVDLRNYDATLPLNTPAVQPPGRDILLPYTAADSGQYKRGLRDAFVSLGVGPRGGVGSLPVVLLRRA